MTNRILLAFGLFLVFAGGVLLMTKEGLEPLGFMVIVIDFALLQLSLPLLRKQIARVKSELPKIRQRGPG